MAWYSPKNGNAWTKCLPNHFGGCFARFLDSVLISGRSKCHFLALENGHFCQTLVHFAFSGGRDWSGGLEPLLKNSTGWVENTVSVKLDIFKMDLYPKHLPLLSGSRQRPKWAENARNKTKGTLIPYPYVYMIFWTVQKLWMFRPCSLFNRVISIRIKLLLIQILLSLSPNWINQVGQ